VSFFTEGNVLVVGKWRFAPFCQTKQACEEYRREQGLLQYFTTLSMFLLLQGLTSYYYRSHEKQEKMF
jgi:hypothetical protein